MVEMGQGCTFRVCLLSKLLWLDVTTYGIKRPIKGLFFAPWKQTKKKVTETFEIFWTCMIIWNDSIM